MTLSPSIRDAMLKAIPHLRAFAISLTGNIDQADDLVQDAILRGLSNIERFDPGSNMQAWLFTILRNLFHTQHHRRKREVEDPNGLIASRLSIQPEQEWHLDLDDLKVALIQLPLEQREALLLVAAQGFSYEETAEICGARIGAIKSRVHRARARLAELLRIEHPDDIGADRMLKATIFNETCAR